MKIKYTPNINWRDNPPKIQADNNYISFSGNDWNDYSIGKTTLNVLIVLNGIPSPVKAGIKLLIEGSYYTAKKLDELCNAGWDGFFPIPDINYISLPTDINFYKTLITHLSHQEMEGVLEKLKDVGYLKYIKEDDSIAGLIDSPTFTDSLLRDTGSNKAYQDGWRLFLGEESQIRDFQLNILSHDNKKKTIPFKFESNLLPYDINVLIGSNGIGKSYCLKSLVEYWLKTGIGHKEILDESGHKPFDVRPNINNLILISYSPFEEFNLTATKKEVDVSDESGYRYFGFRQMRENGSIGISRDLPKIDASNSLIDAIFEDEKFKGEDWWINKFDAAELALKNALKFDYLAIKTDMNKADDILKSFSEAINGETYIKLDSKLAAIYDKDELKSICQLHDGIQFIKDGAIKNLSSGQRLFSYIVINVVGAIREHSLVVIDEPELFLHPTLEIEFISLLKTVLKPFKSKAILATHSVSVVREVPSNCVHIFRDEGQGLEIVAPPFETFGGGVQRISSYVFGDKSVSKPFDAWLKEQINSKSDSEVLIEKLGEEVNEQLIMKILRLGRISGGS
jgi:hypothetical protein